MPHCGKMQIVVQNSKLHLQGLRKSRYEGNNRGTKCTVVNYRKIEKKKKFKKKDLKKKKIEKNICNNFI